MSAWNRRRDTRQNDMAHGITFHMWERSMENCRGEVAYKTKKLHLDGRVSLTIAQNQHKYGDELIAQVYGTAVEVKERRADKYNRIQIYLGQADEHTAEALEQIARTIRHMISQKPKESSDDNTV